MWLAYHASMSNRDILNRALDCFAKPAMRASYFDLYADNVVLHGYPGVSPGLESVKRYYEAFWFAFPDARVTAEDLVEQADKIALRFCITGTHQGPFLSMAATQRVIAIEGITILQFCSGKCIERWSVTDSTSLLNQLGFRILPS